MNVMYCLINVIYRFGNVNTVKRHKLNIWNYCQGRIQDLSQGCARFFKYKKNVEVGTKKGAAKAKFFF